ncbi:hypothetical protein Scep_029679 [Stephania cephalantha]|uniref:Uncharacterized protein n=1 Tax=Stephania cephalantha TaxID=152367 RepID=A0AAP0E1I2_9MAGN
MEEPCGSSNLTVLILYGMLPLEVEFAKSPKRKDKALKLPKLCSVLVNASEGQFHHFIGWCTYLDSTYRELVEFPSVPVVRLPDIRFGTPFEANTHHTNSPDSNIHTCETPEWGWSPALREEPRVVEGHNHRQWPPEQQGGRVGGGPLLQYALPISLFTPNFASFEFFSSFGNLNLGYTIAALGLLIFISTIPLPDLYSNIKNHCTGPPELILSLFLLTHVAHYVPTLCLFFLQRHDFSPYRQAILSRFYLNHAKMIKYCVNLKNIALKTSLCGTIYNFNVLLLHQNCPNFNKSYIDHKWFVIVVGFSRKRECLEILGGACSTEQRSILPSSVEMNSANGAHSTK